MAIKIGNLDISSFKVGSDDCKVYLGDILLYPSTSSFFCKLTLNNGNVVELEGSGELTSTMTKQYSATCISVEIGTLCTSIGSYAFFNYTRLTSIDIPDSVTSFSYNAFQNCVGLTSVTIPNSVTSIDNSAFYGCSGLTSVTIPNSVTSISNGTFNGCSGLKTCTIGSGVTLIGKQVFFNCSGLTSITVEAATPPTLYSTTFSNTNDCPIYVPSGSLEAYKSATNWSNLASRIQAIPNN